MASGTHVSKRKSSSSSHHKKKKLSKKSSEGKKRKVSRSRKRDKFKKLLPLRDVSVSVSSSDESVSSSDSEDGCKRRKGRSRAREDAKGKKRVKRSSSSESPVRKKRRDSSKLKKKLHKKRSKRDASVDSTSCDSRGLSISSASDDSKRLRVRNKVKEEVKSGNEDRYKYRSRSCSSCSEGSYDRSEERLASGSYAGRLRSVLTFPDKVEVEGRYQSKDENKVEIIHAYDEPPPCKSNDSYDVGRKRESSHQASTLPEKKRVVCDGMVEDGRRKESSRELNAPPEKEAQTFNGNEENVMLKTKMVGMVEDERRKEFSHQVKIVPEKKTQMHYENVEDAFTSKSRMTQSTKGIKGDAVAAYGGIDRTAIMESTKTANKSEVSSGIVSSELSDLESILRQKALENFRKFRGGCQPNTTLSDQRSGNGVKKTIKTESSKEVGSSIVRATDTKASEIKHSSTEVMEGIAVTKSPIRGVKVPDCDSKRLESHDTMRATHPPVRRIPDGNSKRLDTCDTRNAANLSQGSDKFVSDRFVDTKTTEKRIINLGGIRKFNHGSLVYRRQASQDYSDGKAQESRSMLNRVVSEPPKAAAESSNPCKSATSEPTSCSTPVAGEQVTTESGNAAKGGSEAKCPETKNTLNKNVPSPPKAAAVGSSDLPKSNKSPGSGASEATSLPTPETGKHIPTESGNAGNGGSEFKQKTMSVMRGGEMVQVSYKVYIPQKPPALARRQLKR